VNISPKPRPNDLAKSTVFCQPLDVTPEGAPQESSGDAGRSSIRELLPDREATLELFGHGREITMPGTLRMKFQPSKKLDRMMFSP
jgi:hypothetical protein